MSDPAAPDRIPHRALALAGTGAILVGAELRLLAFLGNRPLYVDEAMLALNVARRSFAGLLHPLDYDQSGPILFLWLLKLTTLLAGTGELILRSPAFLAGIVLLICYRPLARALAGEAAAPFALALLAICIPLIYYSADLKQYGIDALVTATICLLTLRAKRFPESRRAWVALAIGGALAAGLSMPAAFVLPAAGVALLADPAIRSRPDSRVRLIMVGMTWLATCGLLYFLFYRATMANAYLHRFWEGAMLDFGAGDFRRRAARGFAGLEEQTPLRGIGISPKILFAALAIGVAAIWRRKGFSVALLVGLPFVLVVTASVLGKYPMYDRLLVFLAPLFLAAVTAAVFEAVHLLGRRAGTAAALLLPALVLLLGLPRVQRASERSMVREEGRELLRRVERDAAGEPVYVAASALPMWVWYTTDWQRPDTTRLDWYAEIAKANAISAHNGPSRNRPVQDTEGVELVDQSGGVNALIGIRTGMQFTTDLAIPILSPDSGWAGHEIGRLAARAAPFGWVFAAHASHLELALLRESLQKAGAVTVSAGEEGRAMLLRVRFRQQP